MTFEEQLTALEDTVFVGRIRQAVLTAAIAVMAEEASEPGHLLRVAFANAILSAPEEAGNIMAPGVVTNVGLTSTAAFDHDILYTVNTMFNAFAGVAN